MIEALKGAERIALDRKTHGSRSAFVQNFRRPDNAAIELLSRRAFRLRGLCAGERQLQLHDLVETFGRKSFSVADEMDEDLGLCQRIGEEGLGAVVARHLRG